MGSHQWRSNVNGSKYIEQPLCIRLWSLCCSSRFLHQRLRNPTSKIMNRSNMLSRDKIKQPFILLNKILVFITAIVPKFLTNQIRLLFSPTQDTNDFFDTNIRIFFFNIFQFLFTGILFSPTYRFVCQQAVFTNIKSPKSYYRLLKIKVLDLIKKTSRA